MFVCKKVRWAAWWWDSSLSTANNAMICQSVLSSRSLVRLLWKPLEDYQCKKSFTYLFIWLRPVNQWCCHCWISLILKYFYRSQQRVVVFVYRVTCCKLNRDTVCFQRSTRMRLSLDFWAQCQKQSENLLPLNHQNLFPYLPARCGQARMKSHRTSRTLLASSKIIRKKLPTWTHRLNLRGPLGRRATWCARESTNAIFLVWRAKTESFVDGRSVGMFSAC